MRTTQTNTVTLVATNNVSLYEWKGLTRISISEQTDQTVEISDINTVELMGGISYYLSRSLNECDRDETVTRILTEIAKNLAPLVAPKEPAAN